MKNILLFLSKVVISPLFISIIFFLFLQLPIFNYGFNYRDEGYLLNNAQRINNGEVPYVDFSLAIAPGAFYIQALAFKLFGNYVITDRILYIFCVISILTLNSLLFKFSKYLKYLSMLFLAFMYTGLGAFASYNMYGVVLVMATLFLFKKLKNNNKAFFYSFLIGFMNTLVFIVKQTYGFIFFFSLLFLLAFFIERKYRFGNIFVYVIGSSLLPIFILLTLYLNGILNDVINNILYYALAVKNDRLPFILTSILFIPFFMILVNFIKKFNLKKLLIVFISFILFFGVYVLIAPTRIPYLAIFYKQPTIYYFLLFFTLPLTLVTLFIKSKNKKKQSLVILSIEVVSLFLASSFSGRDYTTVIVTAPLYLPLFIYLLTTEYKKIRLPANNIVIALILIIFVFPSVTTLFGAYGKIYGIGQKKDEYSSLRIKEASGIWIPANQAVDL